MPEAKARDLAGGRAAQKARTRAILLQSASALLQQGRRPTVEEAAEAVGISKRTAYRYFDSQEHMLADAALESVRPAFARILDLSRGPSDPADRLEALIRSLNRMTPDYENELRVIVRAALNRAPGAARPPGRPRGQRRLDWIAEVLAPLKPELPKELYDRLAAALAALIGFDIYIWLREVGELPPEQVDDVMAWMGRALVVATLREAGARQG
jgi:AcrR family transcriptional regulator